LIKAGQSITIIGRWLSTSHAEVDMTLVLTIDPAREISDIIVRLAHANLQIFDVDTTLNLIRVSATFEELAHIGPIPGIISVNVDHPGLFSEIGSIFLQRHDRLDQSSNDPSELDGGFKRSTLN
jgi:hypothetical protein